MKKRWATLCHGRRPSGAQQNFAATPSSELWKFPEETQIINVMLLHHQPDFHGESGPCGRTGEMCAQKDLRGSSGVFLWETDWWELLLQSVQFPVSRLFATLQNWTFAQLLGPRFMQISEKHWSLSCDHPGCSLAHRDQTVRTIRVRFKPGTYLPFQAKPRLYSNALAESKWEAEAAAAAGEVMSRCVRLIHRKAEIFNWNGNAEQEEQQHISQGCYHVWTSGFVV